LDASVQSLETGKFFQSELIILLATVEAFSLLATWLYFSMFVTGLLSLDIE